jgi:hypothetical protein
VTDEDVIDPDATADAAPSDPADPTGAEAEQAVARLEGAIAALDDGAIRAGVAALSEQSRGELADQLHLPRPTMHLGNALPPLLRRKLVTAGIERQLSAALLLSEGPNDDTVHALGARHDDPSREDLLEVLPAVVEQYGTPLVVLMMAAYAASDAPARAVMAALVDEEPQFAIGPAFANDDAHDASTASSTSGANVATGATTTEDPAAQAAKREERKAAKAARRDAAAHERAAKQAAHAARKAAQRKAKHH